ncbi:MAG: glycosyltransferase [bacterium]
MGDPVISVVIPAYNAAEFMRRTVESVLDQTGVTVEVIVVDDGSSDATPEIAAGFGDRIRLERIGNSGGPSIPRNVGVGAASGEYIAFLDADDIMLPGKLAAAVTVLNAHPTVGLLCTEFQGIDGEDRVIRERWLADYREFRAVLQSLPEPDAGLLPAAEAFRQLIRANFVGTSSTVCRRQALADAGPFDESLKNSDDRDMWFRIARAGWDFAFLDRVYHGYRKSGGGVTARGGLRNLAVITGLARQLPYCERPEDHRFLQRRIRELWLGYGYSQRLAGDYPGARAAYRHALALGIDVAGIVGWLRTWFGR